MPMWAIPKTIFKMYELHLKKSYHQVFDIMYKRVQSDIPKVKPQTWSENNNILRSVFLHMKAKSPIHLNS